MRKTFVAVLLVVIASILVSVPAAMSQVATGKEGGGLDTFAPFGKEGQILAQATCTAMRPDTGFTFAVQRICEGGAPSCAEICGNLSEQQAGDLSCFGALHLYANPFFTADETLGLKTLKQTDCGVTVCGPNYCCCGS
jgi:hypothetical protein